MRDVQAFNNFRHNVRTVMADAEISQRELARRAKMSHPYVNRVLQGTTVPSIDCCERIAIAIEAPLESLICHPAEFMAKIS